MEKFGNEENKENVENEKNEKDKTPRRTRKKGSSKSAYNYSSNYVYQSVAQYS